MNKFLIKKISVDMDNMIHSIKVANGQQLTEIPTPSDLTLDLFPCDSLQETISVLSEVYKNEQQITIINSIYLKWIEHFKDEFKEFLLEKYPEEFIKNQTYFNTFIGDI